MFVQSAARWSPVGGTRLIRMTGLEIVPSGPLADSHRALPSGAMVSHPGYRVPGRSRPRLLIRVTPADRRSGCASPTAAQETFLMLCPGLRGELNQKTAKYSSHMVTPRLACFGKTLHVRAGVVAVTLSVAFGAASAGCAARSPVSHQEGSGAMYPFKRMPDQGVDDAESERRHRGLLLLRRRGVELRPIWSSVHVGLGAAWLSVTRRRVAGTDRR